MRISGILLVFCSLLMFNDLEAQDISTLDTVVVQTTNIPLPIQATGRNISVIQAEEIQKMSFTSLDDLLQYIPGIEVQSRNAFGAQGDISMRGATYTQVLVLINGMKLNDPLTGHFNSYMPVAPAEIERIEVLRGAASAIYGADAVGGVINIITKGFVNSRDEDVDVEMSLNYGEHNLVNQNYGFSIRKNNWYFGGGIFSNKSDGEIIPEKKIGENTLEEYANYFDIKTSGLSIGYRFNDKWNIKFRTGNDDRDFSARYFYTTSTFDKSVERTRNWWNQLQLSKIGDKSSTDFQLTHRNGTDEFIFSPDFPSTNLHTTNFWNFNIHHLIINSEQLTTKFGVQADYRSIESTDRGDHANFHTGVYAMANYSFNDQFNLTGSLRLDYDDNYDVEVSPQLNLSYRWNRIALRASAGRSIRAADYTERFVSYNLAALTPGRSLGNPNLQAESAWSEELGVDFILTGAWSLKATGFLRQSNNLVDYVATNADDIERNVNLTPGETYFYASNIANANTAGIEIESWLNKSWRDNASASWSLGYTFLNTSNDEDVISVYLSSHARHLVTTNFILNIDKFDLSLNGRYKQRAERIAEGIGAMLEPSYMVWNAKIGFNLFKGVGLQLNVHNLLNEDYQDFLGAQMPGRWIMGGIKARI